MTSSLVSNSRRSPGETVFDSSRLIQTVFWTPEDAAENTAKCVIVPDPEAAGLVMTLPLVLTLGLATVAADHPVAPTAARAIDDDSVVPFSENATWSVLPDVGKVKSWAAAAAAGEYAVKVVS